MPCRKPGRKSARRLSLARSINPFLSALVVLGLAGCGGQLVNFDTPQRSAPNEPAQGSGANDKPRHSSEDDTPGAPSRLLGKLLGVMMDTTKNDGRAPDAQSRHIFCPEVLIQEGTEASQAYAGTPPSSANLRYQYSLTETARECALDAGQLALKIGVAGKVLLGPAGTAGSFTVPVRVAILRKSDHEPAVSKLYHTTVNLGQSETEADFTIVSESLHVPFLQDHTDEDYSIRVGIDEGPAKNEKLPKGVKR